MRKLTKGFSFLSYIAAVKITFPPLYPYEFEIIESKYTFITQLVIIHKEKLLERVEKKCEPGFPNSNCYDCLQTIIT